MQRWLGLHIVEKVSKETIEDKKINSPPSCYRVMQPCRPACLDLFLVEAVTVNSTQKHFVTASKDNSWCLYDISIGSCLAQVGKGSGQEGYTSASFHPDDLILGTGTIDAIVKLWDFRTWNVVKMVVQVGPVTALSFSNNCYFLATAALDGVKLWDVRKLRNFMTLSPYDSDKPTNAVEFEFTGSYVAIGGSDITYVLVNL